MSLETNIILLIAMELAYNIIIVIKDNQTPKQASKKYKQTINNQKLPKCSKKSAYSYNDVTIERKEISTESPIYRREWKSEKKSIL